MRVFLTLILLLFVYPSPTTAQFDAGGFINTDLTLELDPASPQPGEQVTLTLNDYGSNFYGAQLLWYKDGSPMPGATNQRNITVTAPSAGESETYSLTLVMQNGIKSTIKQTIAPIYADIIIEPQTHVPGFYKGRALPSAGSTINLIALLNNGEMMGTDFVYTWRVNDEVLEAGPLRGRNRISFVAPIDKEIDISLHVSSPDGTVLARRAIFIPSMVPELHFYEVNTLYGVETRAINNNFTMIGDGATIIAEPYYLDSVVFNSPDILEWRINQDRVSAGGNSPYELTLEKTGTLGTATVRLHVRSTTELLQGARGEFKIEI